MLLRHFLHKVISIPLQMVEEHSGIGIAALAVGGGVAYFWQKNKKAKESLEKTLVFDGYDRPYIMNLNRALTVQNSAPTLFNVMNMFDRQTRSVDINMSDNLAVTMHARTNNPTDYVFLKDSDPFLGTGRTGTEMRICQ